MGVGKQVPILPAIIDTSLIPRPRPAFRRLQYGKAGSRAGRAWERGYIDT